MVLVYLKQAALKSNGTKSNASYYSYNDALLPDDECCVQVNQAPMQRCLGSHVEHAGDPLLTSDLKSDSFIHLPYLPKTAVFGRKPNNLPIPPFYSPLTS